MYMMKRLLKRKKNCKLLLTVYSLKSNEDFIYMNYIYMGGTLFLKNQLKQQKNICIFKSFTLNTFYESDLM